MFYLFLISLICVWGSLQVKQFSYILSLRFRECLLWITLMVGYFYYYYNLYKDHFDGGSENFK